MRALEKRLVTPWKVGKFWEILKLRDDPRIAVRKKMELAKNTVSD